MMIPNLLIGYGNPLRQDDGVGVQAAYRLAGEMSRTLAVHQLTPELAEAVSRAEVVLFVDASRSLGPGEFEVRAVEPSSEDVDSHHLTPGSLLALAHSLYGHAPAAFLFTMGGSQFGYGEELSPEVEEALPTLLGEIRKHAALRPERKASYALFG
ncbi:MAG: hydrogenase maturation protease [Bryobacterales bacterium]|jgi:hydrogenase maturation protease|nr:hydrogenase maturation protease [Bryobacterales bacterium]